MTTLHAVIATILLLLLAATPSIRRLIKKYQNRNHHSHFQKRVRGSFAKAKQNSINNVRFIQIAPRKLIRIK